MNRYFILNSGAGIWKEADITKVAPKALEDSQEAMRSVKGVMTLEKVQQLLNRLETKAVELQQLHHSSHQM